MAYGRTVLTNNSVFPTRVSADGSPKYKAGGVTIDWTSVTAVSGSDVTLPDGSIIRIGQKYLRYGQVICKITGGTNTVNTSGTPTGGTFTLTVTTSSPVAGSASQTTGNIAYNASASTVATAIAALTNVGSGNVSASGGALTSADVVLTFAPSLGTVTIALGTNALTGGTTPSVAIGASLTTGSTRGEFGPYDSSASDGRQSLNRGDCFVLDETLLQYGSGSSLLSASNDQVGGAIEGGDIFIDRVLQSGSASHSLAAGPTLSEFSTAFPLFTFVRN